mgnify:CR=1 FL=1
MRDAEQQAEDATPFAARGPDAVLDAGGGVVSGEVRDAVISRVRTELAVDGVTVHRMMDSPVAGRDGNREVLLLVGLVDAVPSAVSSADPAE